MYTCGMANKNENIQIIKIYLIACLNFETTCRKNGWQMVTYLSMVNAVIVKMVAFAEVSAANPCRMQNNSPKIYGYLGIKIIGNWYIIF